MDAKQMRHQSASKLMPTDRVQTPSDKQRDKPVATWYMWIT